MNTLSNSIQAFAKPLKDILFEKKYKVDFFQREYKWQRKHIEQLLVDLEASFESNFDLSHSREAVADYNTYYLGPIVISEKSGIRSIVDGQQRLTSLTLLLIYLNNNQSIEDGKEDLEPYIMSKKYGKVSFNIEVPDRTEILTALHSRTQISDDLLKDESVANMLDRFHDIEALFPAINTNKLSMFIDWLKEKVIFVEIIAYTDENAYTIFETMNDRGLNLTPTEMLKGYLINNIRNEDRISEINNVWKEKISQLHSFNNLEDLEFMRAWLRAKYADSIRGKIKGSGNEDFEKIGTRFHTWVKDNHKKIGLNTPDSYYYFIQTDLIFFADIYLKLLKGLNGKLNILNRLQLSSYWTLASSLVYPFLLASIDKLDDEETIIEKIRVSTSFLDCYTTYRTLAGKPITQTSVRNYIYQVVKKIRNQNVDALRNILSQELMESEDWKVNLLNFDCEKTNPFFLKYILARMSFYVDQVLNFAEYPFNDLMVPRKKNRYSLVRIADSSEEIRTGEFDLNSFQFELRPLVLLGNYMIIRNQLKSEFEFRLAEERIPLLSTERFLFASIQKTDYTPFSLSSTKEVTEEFIRERTKTYENIIRKVWNPHEL